MNFSRTTANFALRRGLEITEQMGDIDVTGTETTEVWIWEKSNDMEPMFMYFVYPNGSMSFKGNVYLPSNVKEEIPHSIRNEKHFREMLDFVSKELY